MEIINIEKKAFDLMMAHFENFANRAKMLCNRHNEKGMSKWYDNQDVCMILKISPRTLQTLRDKGALPHSRLCRKLYYKAEDVENFISTRKDIQSGIES
jgi:hypothetical protein